MKRRIAPRRKLPPKGKGGRPLGFTARRNKLIDMGDVREVTREERANRMRFNRAIKRMARAGIAGNRRTLAAIKKRRARGDTRFLDNWRMNRLRRKNAGLRDYRDLLGQRIKHDATILYRH